MANGDTFDHGMEPLGWHPRMKKGPTNGRASVLADAYHSSSTPTVPPGVTPSPVVRELTARV